MNLFYDNLTRKNEFVNNRYICIKQICVFRVLLITRTQEETGAQGPVFSCVLLLNKIRIE